MQKRPAGIFGHRRGGVRRSKLPGASPIIATTAGPARRCSPVRSPCPTRSDGDAGRWRWSRAERAPAGAATRAGYPGRGLPRSAAARGVHSATLAMRPAQRQAWFALSSATQTARESLVRLDANLSLLFIYLVLEKSRRR